MLEKMKIQTVSLQNTEPSSVFYEFLQEISIRFLSQCLPYLLEKRQPSDTFNEAENKKKVEGPSYALLTQ